MPPQNQLFQVRSSYILNKHLMCEGQSQKYKALNTVNIQDVYSSLSSDLKPPVNVANEPL